MIAKNHTTGEGELKLMRADPGFVLVFDGYRGMETSIHFDAVETHYEAENAVVGLCIHGDILVSEIWVDNGFELSSVGSALRAIEHNQLVK